LKYWNKIKVKRVEKAAFQTVELGADNACPAKEQGKGIARADNET